MNDAELMSAVILAVVVAFYLMFMRPIQQDQKKHRQQIRDLRPGDEVLTTSGFIATIKDIQVQKSGRAQIDLELADGVVFRAVSTAIAERLPPAVGPSSQEPSRGGDGKVKSSATSRDPTLNSASGGGQNGLTS